MKNKKSIETHKINLSSFFKNDFSLYKKLDQGQSPSLLVIACSDSRVDPAILLKAKLGELFSIRNVANIIPPFEKTCQDSTGAGIEYAVCYLEIDHILILGHSDCGGIKALCTDGAKGSHAIASWISHSLEASQKAKTDFSLCEKENILLSLSNLSKFPFIKEKIEKNKISLHAWYFDIVKARIEEYNKKKGTWEALK